MSDVSKIHGPGTPPEPGGKKEKQIADEFKKKMQKVEKASGADAEQKKKRKRHEEVEEEADTKQEGLTPPTKTFSLEEKETFSSIFDVKKPMKKVEGPASSPPPQTRKLEAERPPPDIEVSPDTLEEQEDELPLPPAFQSTQRQETPPQLPQTPPVQTSVSAEPLQVGPPKDEHAEATTSVPKKEKKEIQVPGMPVYKLPKAKKKKAPQAPKKEEIREALPPPKALPREGKEGYFAEMKKKVEKVETKETEEENISQMTGFLPPLVASEKKEEKGDKDKEQELASIAALPAEKGELPLLAAFAAATLPASTPPYAYLHPEVWELFERMVGTMTVATYGGATETTISLNAPQFASSVFYGSQIIIREYSTAPKVFNIELLGSPQAVELFQGNADDLMAAFQNGKYAFRVNQLQTGILRAEKPLIERKEKPSGDKKGKEK